MGNPRVVKQFTTGAVSPVTVTFFDPLPPGVDMSIYDGEKAQLPYFSEDHKCVLSDGFPPREEYRFVLLRTGQDSSKPVYVVNWMDGSPRLQLPEDLLEQLGAFGAGGYPEALLLRKSTGEVRDGEKTGFVYIAAPEQVPYVSDDGTCHLLADFPPPSGPCRLTHSKGGRSTESEFVYSGDGTRRSPAGVRLALTWDVAQQLGSHDPGYQPHPSAITLNRKSEAPGDEVYAATYSIRRAGEYIKMR